MLLAFRPIHMFVLKGPTKYGLYSLLASLLSSFFDGARSFAPIVFLRRIFKKSLASRLWCAHNVLISYHNRTSFLAVCSSLLSLLCSLTDPRWSMLTSRWLMLADRSPYYVVRFPLISARCFPLFLLVAAEFLLLAGLFSLQMPMACQAARLSLPVDRCKLSWILTCFCSGKILSLRVPKAQPLLRTSKSWGDYIGV